MNLFRIQFPRSGVPVCMNEVRYGTSGWGIGPGKRGIRQCVRKLLAVTLLALPVLFGCPFQAAARERVLVSNIGQPDSSAGLGASIFAFGANLIDNAQRFTTGGNVPGYRVSSVEIEFAAFDTGYEYTASIRRDAGGAPGAIVGTLQNPSFTSFTADRVLEFAAPTDSGILLEANTGYFVVIDIVSLTGTAAGGWRATTSNDEDSSGLSGWRIDNRHRFRLDDGGDQNDQSWQDNLITSVLKLRLNGRAVQPPGLAILETDGDTTVSEDGSTVTDTYTVALNTEPTHDVTVTVTAGAGAEVNRAGGTAGPTQTLTFSASGANIWSTAQTITVTGVDDNVVNQGGSRTVKIAHETSSSDSDYTIGDAGEVSVTVTDDGMDGAVPVLSVALPSVEGVTRNTAGQLVFAETGAGTDDPEVSFDVTLAPAPSADFAACIRVTETGGDRVAAADEGVKAVTVPSTGSLVHTVQWTDTAADDRDSVVTVEAVAPGTAGCPAANGTWTVSSTDASDSALVRDDEPTAVRLTSSDTSMAEGDASQTATLTFTLGRQLYADEAVVVPFTFATTTGARLPGHATPDFAATAAGTGVTIANANTATPSLTFTGHGTDTVRTATVTLTPVANRDDGDTAREEITATLAADSVLGSTAGTGTTVGGGAMRHGTDFAAALTLEDDEAPPGSAIFLVSGLRLLENGSATYTVRLNREPTALVSAGVSLIGGDRGAVTTVSSVLFWPGTGSGTSWNTPQTITVTGVDEPGTHRNRATTIRYSLSSTDPAFNGRTFDLPVEVGDAPEVEAWEGWNRADGSRGDDATLTRPHTVQSTPGLWPRQDFAPGDRLDYVIRLSNRPEPGGTVTVNVNRSNSGLLLGLTRDGPWRTSLTVTFGDGHAGGAAAPNMRACNNSHFWPEGGEAHDGTAATSWECWRTIWVLQQWHTGHRCTDLTHTASGGGIRSRTIETIRAHNADAVRNNNHCAILTPNTEPAALNAAAIQVPAAQVANLAVTKVDSTSASASWDAVEHATGYEVAWDALDGGGQAIASGIHAGVTGTTETIEHQAPGAASLEVTVTPEYVDGNGDTRALADLAATATLDLTAPQSAQADSLQAGAASCDLGTLRADIAGYIGEQPETSDHVKRWKRVLAAFDRHAGGMTAAEARTYAGKGWTRWDPVVEALDCLEAAATPQAETPAAVPELSLAAGPAVDEGGSATFTVHADPAPAAELTVAFTVAQSGEYLDAPGPASRTVTLAAGAASATLAIATADDGADEADGSVSVTLDAGTGYALAAGKAAAKVAVRDDDTPVVSVAAGAGVTEGDPATFTVTATPAPAAPLTVALTVTQSGDFAASGQTGTRQVTIPTGGSIAFEVATVNDGADEPDGSVTATLAAGAGYAVAASPDDTASVAVADDDVAAVPEGPSLSVNDVEVKEGPYRRVEFTVTLSEASDRYVSFSWRVRESDPVSAKRGVDFWASTQKNFAGIRPGQTEYRIRAAMVIDDSHDEDPETFEIVLSDAHGAAIADGLGVATIVNDDPMPAAWLSRFGRTVAQQALDGISDRMAAERTPGVTGTLAGHMDLASLSGFSSPGSDGSGDGDIVDGNGLVTGNGHGWRMKETGWGFENSHGRGLKDSYSWSTREMTLREAVMGSSFTATGREDAMGGSLSFWGRGGGSSFDGREGTFSLDGDASTAMLGADYARDGWLLGLALLQSDGEGGYADAGTGTVRCPQPLDGDGRRVLCGGAVREGDGRVESTLTAAVPYGSLRMSDRVGLWGAFGHGAGTVFLRPHTVATGDAGDSLKSHTVTTGDILASDISWTMASMGMRGDLLRGNGPALALTADALWARTESDGTGELAGSDSDVTRLRLGLEGSWKVVLSGGGRITPKLELGIRHDGGDAETGSGIELGAGVSWSSPATGIRLDLSGRTLVSHDDDDLEDRGFSADLSFDPDGNTGRGPSFSLRQDVGGQSEGGLEALFRPDPLGDRAGSGDGKSRWTLEGAWGFPALGGRYTGSPHAGMGISGDTRDWSVGWCLAPESGSAADLSFGVRATRRESLDTAPEHVFGFEASLRW